MRKIIILALSLFCVSVSAAPSLVAAEYPPGVVQPTSASCAVVGTVNSTIVGTVKTYATSAAAQPVCDLASLTASGTYTITMAVCNTAPVVTNTGSGTGTIVTGGCSEAAPFVLTLKAGLATVPVTMLAP